jgi:hypothetical protein
MRVVADTNAKHEREWSFVAFPGSATPMRGKSATCRQVFSEFSGL